MKKTNNVLLIEFTLIRGFEQQKSHLRRTFCFEFLLFFI